MIATILRLLLALPLLAAALGSTHREAMQAVFMFVLAVAILWPLLFGRK